MTIEIPLSKQGKYAGLYVTIVDDEDRDLAEFNWSVNISSKEYSERVVYTPRKRRIKMHREVLSRIIGRELEKGEMPDHINGNGLDNRRENLRLSSLQNNPKNCKTYKNSVTGHRGVFYKKDNKVKRYGAKIQCSGVVYFLGYFHTIEEASEVYEAKAKELFGRLYVKRS